MIQKKLNILIFLYSVFFYGQDIKKTDYDFLQIPVVFHIVNSDEISEADKIEFENKVKIMVQSINDRMKILDKDRLQNGFDLIAAIPKIELFLPNCDIENKPISSISWHKIPKYYFRDYIPIIDDRSLKQFGYLDKNHFLNIWIIDILGSDSQWANIAGYVPNKLLNDGIVLDIDDFEYMVQDNFIVIHELGHYLGLKHIWGNRVGCRYDDGIFDTPPQERPHKKGAFNQIQYSCNNLGKTNHQNFMDYSYDTGMFTQGQVEVMRNNLKTKRAGLLWKENCKEAPSPTIGFFKDKRNNKSYKWVQIGSQKWMTKNLNYKTENSTCYNNIESNCTIYGRLYNWNEAMTACPEGWRLPKTQDWKQMAESVSYNLSTIKSSEGWIKENGSNYSELNILPSGYYTVTRRFRGLGQRASFWLADDLGNNVNRNSRTIRDGFNQIPTSGINFAREKLSCRCIQDINAISQQLPSNNETILKKTKLDRKAFYSFMIKTLNLEYKGDKFLKEYLQRTRKVNPKNEFENQRLLSEVKSEITRNISQFDYQNKFYLDYNTSLGKYSFDSKKFTLKLPKTLYDIGYYHLFDGFKIIGRDASSYGGFEMYAANFKDFKEIPISENEAENFLNN